jgi:CRP-like cAMP-binding protein
VSAPRRSDVRNRLLAALAPDDRAALQPHLEPVKVELRQVLIEPGKPIEHVYFHETGYTSMTTSGGGAKIEVGIIGREGMVGVFVALGVRSVPFELFVQAAGEGFRMRSDALEAVLDARPTVRLLLMRYAHVMGVQTTGTAFANAEHTVEARLARWLLMCHDRLDGDDITITHDFMSMMLGVRRAGVTTATHVLEGNGLIRAKRGVITVLNREKLEELADNSYGLPEAEYERLIAGR